MSMISYTSARRGFTLLIAALVSSVVLAIGASIFQLAQKAILLSAIGRDSQFAFYAADTGAECALYWDSRFKFFQAGTPPGGVTPTCDGQAITESGRQSAYPQTMTFQFQPDGRCVNVSVEKTVNAITNGIATTITSDGFSTDCASVGTSDRALQRTLEFNY